MNEMRLQIGELARATGLTVRTLHHWHAVGLLVPSGRTDSGYRVYSEDDVARLYRIVALRSLGLSLREIREALAGQIELRAVVERQLAAIDEAIELQRRLRERLPRVLEAPTGGALIEAMELMAMIERHYTDEQLEELRGRAETLGPAGLEESQDEWISLVSEIEHERAAGTDPADGRVQRLLDRVDELIEGFTGGDPAIRASLERMYEAEGPERASRGIVSSEAFEYLGRARAARRGAQ